MSVSGSDSLDPFVPAQALAGRRFSDILPLPGAPVHVDLGTGLGHFVAAMAAAHPESNWLGLEWEAPVLKRAARRCARAELANATMVRVNARPFLRELVPPESLDHLWLNFPDPWPKDRHADRRHTHPWMVELMVDRLRLGGSLHLATDAEPFHADLAAALADHPAMEPGTDPDWVRRDLGVQTKYERKWRQLDRPVWYGDWRKTAATDATPFPLPDPTPPPVAVDALPPAGVRHDDGRLLKVFAPRRGQPGRARFLLIDTAHGLETPGEFRSDTGELVLMGVWAPWKAALVEAALAEAG